jgi:taspase, threonine aspartase, 1
MPFRKHREGGDICAIFVHAGAGFHSHANEKHHLSACQDAAKVAMTILKNGGEATDAVEMAIKVLEDREITNAGYGSNLTMDGTVECDATIVDHLGRSGAVGAVSRKCPKLLRTRTSRSLRP